MGEDTQTCVDGGAWCTLVIRRTMHPYDDDPDTIAQAMIDMMPEEDDYTQDLIDWFDDYEDRT